MKKPTKKTAKRNADRTRPAKPARLEKRPPSFRKLADQSLLRMVTFYGRARLIAAQAIALEDPSPEADERAALLAQALDVVSEQRAAGQSAAATAYQRGIGVGAEAALGLQKTLADLMAEVRATTCPPCGKPAQAPAPKAAP